LLERKLRDDLFGEGITILGNKIFQLTWKSREAFAYHLGRFDLIRKFTYDSEGWGLTTDGHVLIMSDGTSTLRMRDPTTFRQTRTLEVRERDKQIPDLNELEYVEGEIYANVWRTHRIVRISPVDGRVLGWIDLQGLLTADDLRQPVDVLNGIAYDPG